ncbi:MAG: thiamine pyrophosphate-requiring protein [SAR202 cluster bacterium]|nr:thiamine pyrophosphate-requiring protein [SAR202 cluster bacterium]|tara:strand:- start:77246 stop:78886 length:1641 start_codon:yes stop_codon:yes gene_type:complete
MIGDELIAKILKQENVEWIGAYPYHSLIDEAAKLDIKPIIPRQERAGVNIADGFSRINNGKKIGVFVMQRGPGAENAFSGVAQAFSDAVPILLLPGGHERDKTQRSPEFDSVEHFKGITKWSANINMVERIPELLGKAFSLLKHGRPGPVLLEIPQDVANEEFQGPSKYTPVSSHLSSADPDSIKDIIKALMNSKNPVINAGQGILYAEATKELIEFSELTNIPVMTTLAGKSAFPENHPLALGTAARTGTKMCDYFLKNTDFILGIGTSFTKGNFQAPMPDNVPIAQSTNCNDDINKDYRIDLGAIGDSKLVLKQMIEEVKIQFGKSGRQDTNQVKNKIKKLKDEFISEWLPHFTSDELPMSPYRVFHELAKTLGSANVIITHDSGYPRDQLSPFWQPTNPRGYIGWGKSTQLGYGLGLAIGAKIAAPEKHVVNIMGDASFGMAGMDIETATRCEIGTLTIILNNGVMTHYSDHMPVATKKWDSNKFSGNYSKVAEGLGAFSKRVETPNQISEAINLAIQANSQGQPAVLEMITKEEDNVPNYWF